MTTPVLRGSTAPLPGRPDGTPFGQNTLQATSPDSTLTGDLVLCVSWHGTPSATGSAFTLRSGEGWTQLFNYFHDDGSSDGCFAAAWKIATQAGAQVYQAFNDTGGYEWADCRTALRIYQVGTFDTSSMPTATPVSFIDGNVAPDPGNISGLDSARDYLIEAIGGWWHNQDLVVCTPGSPSGYSNLIDTSAGGWLELALANKAASGVTSENPGVFTDNVSSTNTNGSVGGAIAILGAAGTARRSIITQAELEVPEADPQRRAIITQVELEIPNKKFPETLTYIFNRSWNRYKFQSEDPQPVGTRQAIITQAELEVPDLGRRAIISWGELEVSSPATEFISGSWMPGASSYITQYNTWIGNSTHLKIIPAGVGVFSSSSWSAGWAAMAGSVSVIAGWTGAWLAGDSSRRMMINVPLAQRISGGARQPLADVAAGNNGVGAGVDALADALMAHGMNDAILRIGWEMDGDWFNWGIRQGTSSAVPASNSPTTYKAAWQFVVDRFRARQPTNQWTFDFCISGNDTSHPGGISAWLASIYPGDSYVDTIGIDQYDKSYGGQYPVTSAMIAAGTAQARWDTVWAGMQSYLTLVKNFAVSHGKKISFPEWGVHWDSRTPPPDPGGNDNPNYITKMHEFMSDPNNACDFQVYFNVNPSSFISTRIVSATPPAVQFPFPNAEAKYKLLFG